MRLVKGDSSEFINKEKLTKVKFQWQSGYAAFSNSHSQIDKVVNYILNQKEHHKKICFNEEYLAFLEKYNINYDPKYIFTDLE
jgi:putative transposase